MSKRNAKRINPHRIPIARTDVNIDALIAEANQGTLYHAWLIVFLCLLEQENLTHDEAIIAWNAVNDYNSVPKRLEHMDVAKAEELTGITIPHKDIYVNKIQSAADLDKIRQTLKRSAMGVAFGTIGLGFYYRGHFTEDRIKRIFFNADLTLAEIEQGIISYEKISEELLTYGIQLNYPNNNSYIPSVQIASQNT